MHRRQNDAAVALAAKRHASLVHLTLQRAGQVDLADAGFQQLRAGARATCSATACACWLSRTTALAASAAAASSRMRRSVWAPSSTVLSGARKNLKPFHCAGLWLAVTATAPWALSAPSAN